MTRSNGILVVCLLALALPSIVASRSAAMAQDLEPIHRALARGLLRDDFTRRVVADRPVQVRGAGANIYRDRVAGVVMVVSPESFGTGTLLNREGDILTNDHVVRTAHRANGAEWVYVGFRQSQGTVPTRNQLLTAKVMKKDPQHDLAIVRLTERVPDGAATVPLASTRPEIGGDVFVIGHPQKLFWSLTQGIVSQIRPAFLWTGDDHVRREATIIQTQAPVNPGNSGGPLLDAKGDLAGVVSFSRADSQGLFFAVDAQHVRDLIARSGPDPRPVVTDPRPAPEGKARPDQPRPGQPGSREPEPGAGDSATDRGRPK